MKRKLAGGQSSAYGRLGRLVVGMALVLASSACTAFDPLDNTGETLNRNTTDYANDAVLLNVVRSKLQEPLSFISITSITGSSSISGSLGFSGFTLGPTKAAPTYVFGPNSASRANSNTFNVSVVDDPASFAALLAPVNPALLAFFINQGYPRELLFFLFTDRLRQVEEDAKGNVSRVVAEYFNDPDQNNPSVFGQFISTMSTLLNLGLVAEIDITSTPTGRALPPSKLCIDPAFKPPAFSQGARRPPPPPANSPALCENTPWIVSRSAGAAAAGSGSSGGGSVSSMVATRDGTLWAALGASNEIVRITPNGRMNSFSLPSPPKPSRRPATPGLAAFEFDDGQGHHFQLFTRSTYGAYNYIGALLRNHTDIDNLLQPDSSSYRGIIQMVRSGPDCFAEIRYHGEPYCVPSDAVRTKRIFALLHQLQQLNTAPSNAPAAITTIPVQ